MASEKLRNAELTVNVLCIIFVILYHKFYDLQIWQYVRSLLKINSFISPFVDTQDDKEDAITIAALIFVSWYL